MTSLPHTPATREPLTTLVTELFGDQLTPAPQFPADLRTAGERWQDAVTQVGEQLRTKLRVDVLPERLHKALVLVLAQAVTLHPDGTASVQSGKQTYTLAPECPCADALHRTELCKHTLAVELHRRALALLDDTATALALASSMTSSAVAAPAPSASAPRASAVPRQASLEDTWQEHLPSADRWDVTEAPASCCLRLRIGDLELMYTMRDVSDAELTGRVQHLVPWVQDILDQARERQTHLDTFRQQREAASASSASHALGTPADLEARIDQAVQQALAAQQAPSTGTPPATGHGSDVQAPTAQGHGPAAANGATPFCHVHQVAMEQRSNATGSWWSHWLASEQRYCKGKA